MKSTGLIEYAQKRIALTEDEVDRILEKGKELAEQSHLIPTLTEGGAALFPHANIEYCGDQIAAVAYASIMACQTTGKKQLLVLGVCHALTDQLGEARQKEVTGLDVSKESCRGVFGPGLPNQELLCLEFSLDHFQFLIQRAAEKWGVELPKLMLRYPNLVNGKPETLPGIEEVENLASQSIVVATGDLCHHGKAYGEGNALGLTDAGLALAKRWIEENLSYLSNQDYLGYRDCCLRGKSDSKDVGQILQYLLGPLKASICDLRLVDASDLYEGNPQPSWVAGTLVKIKLQKSN